MSMKKHTKKIQNSVNKFVLLAWLILPILVVWVSVNYLIGSINKPAWYSADQTLGAVDVIASSISDEEWKWNGNGVVTLWFDDAWLSQYKNGFPYLEEMKMKAAVAVPTDTVGFEAYMNWTHIKRLQSAGWEITSHSRTHNCETPKLSPTEMENEILGSKKILEQRGYEINIYVAPCGANSEASTQMIKKYYAAARNVEPGLNPIPLDNFYDIKVIAVEQDTSIESIKEKLAEAKEKKQWMILMFHEVSDIASEYGSDFELYKQIIDEVTASQLEVVLPSQIINL
jgi:peptidoglycan/xylan/chitin deacetylase (PgdA/CDA1 family)